MQRRSTPQPAKTIISGVAYADCGTGGAGRVTITFASSGVASAVEVTDGDYTEATIACIEGRFAVARVVAFAEESHTVAYHITLPSSPPTPSPIHAPPAQVDVSPAPPHRSEPTEARSAVFPTIVLGVAIGRETGGFGAIGILVRPTRTDSGAFYGGVLAVEQLGEGTRVCFAARAGVMTFDHGAVLHTAAAYAVGGVGFGTLDRVGGRGFVRLGVGVSVPEAVRVNLSYLILPNFYELTIDAFLAASFPTSGSFKLGWGI